MKRFVLIALVLLFAIPAFAQDRQLGGDVGVIMSADDKPHMAYAVIKDWSLKNLAGPAFERIEASFVYSPRPDGSTDETYMVRGYTTRHFELKSFYAGAGLGRWQLFNTNGGDEGHWAAKFNFGYRYKNYIDGHLFAEMAEQSDGPGIYFCGAGIVIGW